MEKKGVGEVAMKVAAVAALTGKVVAAVGLLAAMGVVGALSGCGVVEGSEPLVVVCPDPDERLRLEAGATYRDLALSRTEALHGWRICYDAVDLARQ